ncbi:phosphotransferase [Bifidobacterium sp.]|jgi:hypothetical protein|uniref:phosphotransferase n=1 Tax=Bifidobacterium sp. TaxID=41200 RepID=UPI0025BA2C5C|nr:phosphotransferase [Bifidobacterium sp.]MCH4210088.1 phosphotransferase [Bifidobacterium sp.]MCI1225191.1 phosphotransferase [Bifidobacterium sp.]
MLAALASAAMPSIAVAGARASEQTNATDEETGIDAAVVQDTSGTLYDVFASATSEGKRRLARRVRAANTLSRAREPSGLGFGLDHVLAFEDGASDDGTTGGTAVLVGTHHEGKARPLGLLTLDDCAGVGTAIGAIHRIRPGFLQEAHYPVFTTGQIRAQLTAWIRRLRQAGHIPPSITSSWSNIIETEGLWSFATCTVHGGFSDGDILFSGSTITAVTNWQDMQVNDPARDLAWLFAKLDEDHRNAVLTAYGRMLGSRLDDLIMLRANLWLQMEQVGEFIQALNHADNAKIMQFKAQVEHLAHQLAVATQRNVDSGVSAAAGSHASAPSTITVGTLLSDAERRRAALKAAERERARQAQTPDSDGTGRVAVAQDGAKDSDGNIDDNTDEADRTNSSRVTVAHSPSGESPAAVCDPDDSTADDSTADRQARVADHSRSATIALGEIDSPAEAMSGPNHSSSFAGDLAGPDAGAANADGPIDDSAFGRHAPTASNDTSTILIPLQEREQRALRDAGDGLDYGREDNDDTRSGAVRIYPDRNIYPTHTHAGRNDAAGEPGNAAAAGADHGSDVGNDGDADYDSTGESMPKA